MIAMHWLSWQALAQAKVKGGMSFHDLQMFNIDLLGKHGWRLLIEPDCLCAPVIKGRYFSSCDFIQATVPKNSLATWWAIVEGRKALHTYLIKRIGDDTTVFASSATPSWFWSFDDKHG